jgi:hypothetical protein
MVFHRLGQAETMKDLTLAADYLDYSLKEDTGESVHPVLLSSEVLRELEAWNSDYQSTICLPVEERASPQVLDKIQHLDARGLTLATIVEDSIVSALKVAYYSEGLQRRL